MTDIIQVFTTTAERADAEKIAAALLQRRLAACAQVSGPVHSRYWWKGKVESSEEWVCAVKTRRDLYAQVEQAIAELHAYEQPEILAVPVMAGSPGYIQWLCKELRRPPS